MTAGILSLSNKPVSNMLPTTVADPDVQLGRRGWGCF